MLELKDKMEDMAVAPAVGGVQLGAAGDDALSALVNLGYARDRWRKELSRPPSPKDAAVAGDFEGLFRAAMAAIR